VNFKLAQKNDYSSYLSSLVLVSKQCRPMFIVVLLLCCRDGVGRRRRSDVQPSGHGHGFDSQSGRGCVTTGEVVHTHAPLSPAKFGAVTLCGWECMWLRVAESYVSLPPGLWLRSPAGWLPRTGISSATLYPVLGKAVVLRRDCQSTAARLPCEWSRTKSHDRSHVAAV